MTDTFSKLLKQINIKITKFDPTKSRSVTLSTGGTLPLDKFRAKVLLDAGTKMMKFPDLYEALDNLESFSDIVAEFCRKDGTLVEPRKKINIPESFKSLTLNLDQTHQGRDAKFFMTTDREIISEVSGSAFIAVCRMKIEDAVAMARVVAPKYNARSTPGVYKEETEDGIVTDVFNTYIPPKWQNYEGDLPDRLPKLFEKLITHLFPLEAEREYFYSWLYYSLFERAFVYLILCGLGATGKNRLKLVLRALHGHSNTVDGKKSTLVERFNSQLSDSTLTWFDELHYDMDMENTMKEIQNDTISIERKGFDATRSTRIYSSSIISNNKPRDNYIAFDSRKFVPLVLSNSRLDSVMTDEELDSLTRKVEDPTKPGYDISFIAQIGRWIKKHGKSRKWRMLEYKGPMFYTLAHTSMSRWQKKAASTVLETPQRQGGRATWDMRKGFLWSTVEDMILKKNPSRQSPFPDYSSVKHFFEIFVDSRGKKAFTVTAVEDSVMGDFWIKPVFKDTKIITDTDVIKSMGVKDGKEESISKYDL